jgi:hypothetical protein
MKKKNGEWEVELTGNPTDLKQLERSFNDQEQQIIEREGKFFLKSSKFEDIDDPGEIRRISNNVAVMLTGASALRLGSKSPIRIGGVYKLEGRGRSVYVETNAISASARVFTTATVIRKDGKVEISNPADPVRMWLQVAQKNSAAKDVLELLNAEKHDWVNLYRIYELIEDDVGGPSEMARIGGASKASLERFTHTSNSRKAAGIQSRHSVERTAPPKNPMAPNEARAMIFEIIKAWLNAKCK